MKELPDDLYGLVSDLSQRGNSLADTENYADAYASFHSAYTLLPIPREEWGAALWLLSAMGDVKFLGGEFETADEIMNQALRLPDAGLNPFLQLRIGQIAFELNDLNRSAEHLTRAYMLDGEDVFSEENPKYFEFLKAHIKPPSPQTSW